MADRAPFATRTVWWLIVVGAVSFGGATIFTVLNERVRSTGANTFSVSAIGHRAFVRTLERLDIPVVVSRYHSADKVGSGGVLVIAEPAGRTLDHAGFAPFLNAPDILYVLPKRRGDPEPDQTEWLRRTELLHRGVATHALGALGLGGDIVRRVAGFDRDADLVRAPKLLLHRTRAQMAGQDGRQARARP